MRLLILIMALVLLPVSGWGAEKYYAISPYTLLQDFDSLTGFTIGGTPTVAEIDTTIYKEGTGSLKITASASAATVDFTASPGLRFSTTNPIYGLLRIYLPVGSNATSVLVYLSTSAGFGAGTWTSATPLAYEGVRAQAAFKSGWNNLLLTRSSFTGGTPTLLDSAANSFTTIRVRVDANKGPVHFDALYIGGPSRPKALVMFDDAHESILTVNSAVFGTGKSAFDYMRDNNIKGTLYVASDLINTAGYLTTAQVNTLYAAGWDIANHTKTHTTISALTNEQIASELEACDTFLATNGWNRASKHFAYPTGAFTLDSNPAFINSLGYKTARSIQATLLNTQYKPDNMHHLWAKGVGTGITAANMTAKVDEAIAQGRMFAAYIHGLNATETSYFWDPAKFKTLVDYLVTKRTAGQIDIQTISEWYNGLMNIRKVGNRGFSGFNLGFGL